MSLDLFRSVLGETELGGDEHFLSSREFHLGSSHSFQAVVDVGGVSSDGHQGLANLDSADLAVWLSEGSSHTRLESISTCAGEHLVDSDDVPRVDSDSHVEVVLTAGLDHVLVASNTASLQSLRTELFLFI